MTKVLSIEEKIELYFQEFQNQNPDVNDVSEGSILDHLAGTTALIVDEADRLILQRFRRLNFLTATGQDLEDLATDHFGPDFSRPQPVAATGTVTFSRPNTGAGNVTIPEGTTIRTQTTGAGASVVFETTAEVELTGTTIDASIVAVEVGPGGNVAANKITVIESTLSDSSITVDNAEATSGGKDEETDEEYRQTIWNLIAQLAGATVAAIEAKAKSIPGIEFAKLYEANKRVSEIDFADALVGEPFEILVPTLYIADANGNASSTQIAEVQEELETVRAAGVRIAITAAVTVEMNWTANITLDASGPNYTTLQSDTTLIENAMRAYIDNLGVGVDFDISAAETHILGIFGSGGTGDLTVFDTVTPTGNIDIDATEKLIPDNVEIVN